METLQPTDDERKLYEVLSKLPDFDRFPLPKDWYSKFPIPPPKILSITEALQLQAQTKPWSDIAPYETRPPAEGGVRPLLEPQPVEITFVPDVSIKDIDLSGNILDETYFSKEGKSTS
jgi:hypothetical protein